jgi:hypothetical protein
VSTFSDDHDCGGDFEDGFFELWFVGFPEGIRATVTSVPEPGTLGLILLGLSLVGLSRRRFNA